MDRNARTKRIWETIRDIPPGNVASYGQIAEIAGIPRGARQTAYALRVAPDDLELPWYRVITASGKLAFEKGTAHFRRQRDLLRAEGVTVTEGKVDMSRFRWQPDLDELLWKPTSAWDE
jgi:methylated-DNA-protein-cysteine methyltransferase-like protein